jgi:hypothetical protein
MTLFKVFDVPVFWPILLMYWVLLFVVTMKRQIKHMIKYKYLPFTIGKKVGTRVPGSGSAGRTPGRGLVLLVLCTSCVERSLHMDCVMAPDPSLALASSGVACIT